MNPGYRVRLTQSSHLQQDSGGHHWANARNLLICLCLTKPIIFLIVILFIFILYLSLFLNIPEGYYSAVHICLPASLSPFRLTEILFHHSFPNLLFSSTKYHERVLLLSFEIKSEDEEDMGKRRSLSLSLTLSFEMKSKEDEDMGKRGRVSN